MCVCIKCIKSAKKHTKKRQVEIIDKGNTFGLIEDIYEYVRVKKIGQ